MAAKRTVHLTIEVPDDVNVVPVIVRKAGRTIVTNTSAPGMRMVKFDLTTSRAAEWMNSIMPRASECCCVRGYVA
jgi:hypothetical protein